MTFVGRRAGADQSHHRRRGVGYIDRAHGAGAIATRIGGCVSDGVAAHGVSINCRVGHDAQAAGAGIIGCRAWVNKCPVTLVSHRVYARQGDNRRRGVGDINRARRAGAVAARIGGRVGNSVAAHRAGIDRRVGHDAKGACADVVGRRAWINKCPATLVRYRRRRGIGHIDRAGRAGAVAARIAGHVGDSIASDAAGVDR